MTGLATRPPGRWRRRAEGATRGRRAISATAIPGSRGSALAAARSLGDTGAADQHALPLKTIGTADFREMNFKRQFRDDRRPGMPRPDGPVACRLLRECRIEERANGKGFKIVGYAGSGFFSDYENIYRRKLPAPEIQLLGPEPLIYLHEFHKQLGHEQEEFTPREVAYVRELLARYGDQGVKSLMSAGQP